MTDFRLGCVVYRLASVIIRWVAEVNDSGQAENQLPHDLNPFAAQNPGSL